MNIIATYLIPLLVATFFIFTPKIKKIPEWFIVIIHELGHGFIALLFGGGIAGIKLHADGSGSANTTHRKTPLYKIGRTATLFAGYSFPIYFGATLIITSLIGQAQIGITILLTIGIITIIFLRNFFGFIIIGIYLGFLIILNFFFTEIPTEYIVNFMGFLFIIRGIYDLIEITPIVFNPTITKESDFHLLAQESSFIHSPRIWFIIFIISQIVFILLSYFIAEKLFI